ncbi:hypothetical protein HD598_002146 [Neomicrococcus aestuarii]|uniref:Uncharacterized protein n=1 Tax=Neomicrococcus aestuarii TaxID=556325 RepID=A0A7W8TV42_9MICC|nr:hypothetical protein [Neomicrococcus aestuarii]MBB5513459.1 hypothetical protein [Neomicrococcus aestuarii]
MNKHYDNALKIIETAGENFIQDEGWTETTAMMATIDANTHASLALAYEQRTANLLHALEISARSQGTFDREELKLQVEERLDLK